MKNHYFIEMTDTFGGEANYCWVHRFIVSASSERGAMRKVSRETGFTARCTMPGDPERWDAVGACVCYFVECIDAADVQSYRDNHSNVKEL